MPNNSFSEKIVLIKNIMKQYPDKRYRIFDIRNGILESSTTVSQKEIKKYWEESKINHKINFYIHFPFCKQKCFYCREESTALEEDCNVLNKYLNYIINNINHFSKTFKDKKFYTLYIGGGTPSLLSEQQLDLFLKELFSKYSFEKNAQKTFEFDPESMTKKKLDIIKKYGIDRISFGVQTLNKEIIEHMGRVYTPLTKIKELINYSKEIGIDLINVDLIVGLKNETLNSFLDSFEKICQSEPSNIYVYPLSPTNAYVDKFYDSNLNLFYSELNNSHESVLTPMKTLSNKYSYNCDNKFETGNRRGYYFYKKKNTKCKYKFITPEPNYCFGIGQHAVSRIFGKINYNDITSDLNNPEYNVQETDYDYEIICYFSKNLHVNVLDVSKFKEYFKLDVTNRYKNELDFLLNKKKITVNNENIILNSKNQKDIFQFFLMFLTLDQLKTFMNQIQTNQ